MNKSIMVVSAIGLVLTAATATAAPNWGKAPAKNIPLVYNGQASLEWALRGTEHGGAKAMKKHETCRECHDQEADDIGRKIVSGEKLEPKPIKGKPGVIPVTVQATYDAANLYIRMQWKDTKAVSGEKMDKTNQVKASMMLDDGGKVEYANEGGCWASCHHDLRSMPDVDPNASKHPQAKALDIRSNGPTKYLKESRTDLSIKDKPRGGWNKPKSDTDIAAALKEGKFLDIVQFRSAAAPRDGYVLDARRMKEVAGVAEGKLEGGTWTVTFVRKLAGGEGDHKIAAGRTYNIGFAIHDDYTDYRFHHVSFGHTLALDNPKAIINAVKQ